MAADEFQKIEAYLRDLEALKYYRQVKDERDSLAVEATQSKDRVAQLEAQLATEVAAKNDLSSLLTKTGDEAKELAGRLGEAEKELSSLREFKVKFSAGGELTLEEMRDQFLRAREEEIEKRVKEGLAALEEDMRSRMPTLVHENLIQILSSLEWPPEIAEAVDSRAGQIADDTLGNKDGWPDWFKKYYLEEVNALVSQQLTAEFEKRVRAETEKRVELMKAREWQGYVASKVRTLAASLKGLLNELQGRWGFPCDRCGCQVAIVITASHISVLLRGGTIDIACATCLDPAPFPFIFSTIQHKIVTLNLEGLLASYIGRSPT